MYRKSELKQFIRIIETTKHWIVLPLILKINLNKWSPFDKKLDYFSE